MAKQATLILSGIIIYIIRSFLIKELHRKDNLEEHQKVRLVKTVTTVLGIIAVVIVVSGYGLQTNSLLALMGVVGLALSLALQGLMSNFFSGCVLPITRLFREGDVIEVGGTMGIIEHIGYFNTSLVTIDNITIVIPNSILTSSCITNYSAKKTLVVEQSFDVSPTMKDEDVRTALKGAIGKDPRILTDPEPVIRIQSFNSMNVTYTVEVSCQSENYYDVIYTLIENVYASFMEHAIEMGIGMMSRSSGGAGGGRGGMGQQSGNAGGGRGGMGQQAGGTGGRGGANAGHGGAQQEHGNTNGSHQA